MSHCDITIQTFNFMSGNTNSDSGGGGGGGSSGDTHIAPSRSVPDLTNKVHINMSKINGEEPSANPTGNGDDPGNDTNRGQPGLVLDSLSVMQLKRLVVKVPRLKQSLRKSLGILVY
ncbi:hypothetical protein L873DRAFT_1790424 [Choiromyces venosus 120613-1]|uniref:Uncharacterized protein n=1 Tax=Choiromyces venosus 120613-1 TaxID=1336337 RepID=A0A3N4JQ92_9PEZI|nr:hypothetical protein L873DRAFT_1790424 [Choiromyces venosus 120613-1]